MQFDETELFQCNAIENYSEQEKVCRNRLLRLRGLANTAVVDFIEELMSAEDIFFKTERSYNGSELIIAERNYDMPVKDDISELLNKCILLNTYLGKYFVPSHFITTYDTY